MLNSEVAATPTRLIFDKIKFIIGDHKILDYMTKVPVLPLFSDRVTEFFDSVSRRLLANTEAKKHSDIMAYAFWLRRASLEKARQGYDDYKQRLGRGLAFHITPSNIPVQFAVSIAYALVSGNASVVKVSNKPFIQVDIICEIINEVLEKQFADMRPYLCVIRYDHDDTITGYLSKICDIRLIWGGNTTIEAIKKMPVQPRCLDICFADRYSYAVIDADEYLAKDEYSKSHIANDFYIDTYYSDQNACSSTRLIIWFGVAISKAKEIFWKSIRDTVQKRYEMNAISASDKLLNTAVLAARHPDVKMIKEDNLLVRVEIPELFEDISDYLGNSGYFLEYSANDLEEIVPILRKECQTITYLGNIGETVRQIVSSYGLRGVDRIVPIGHSMDLSLVWDSYDIPLVLSRIVSNI